MKKEVLTGEVNGFKYTMDKRCFKDMEVAEYISDLSGGDISTLKPLMEKMFGKEQKKALYEHCRDEDGFVDSEAVASIIQSIFEEASKNLKS